MDTPHLTARRIRIPRFGDSVVVMLSLVLVTMAALTFVLGLSGLMTLRQPLSLSFLDIANAMIGLYLRDTPEWQTADVELPLSYQIAEVLGPLSTGYAVASTGAVLLTNQWRLLRARAARSHAIVCAGDRTGIALARTIAEHRRAVLVTLAARGEGTGVALVRRVLPLTGDPCDPLVLRRAGAARAAELYALADTDEVNASIVLAASAAARDRRQPLGCYALVNDSDLYLTLLARLITKDAEPSLTLNLLDRHQVYASAVLDRERASLGETTVVLGSGPLAAALAVEVVRSLVDDQPVRSSPHRLLLLGPDGTDIARAIHARWPAPELMVDVTAPPDVDVGDRRLGSGNKLAVFVAEPANDRETLRTGLTWLHHWGSLRRVVLCMASDSGLTSAFSPEDSDLFVDADSPLRVYSPLVALADPGHLQRQRLGERLARRLHLIYRQEVAQGLAPGEQLVADQPWAQLPADLQESNRAQAADLGHKVVAAGFVIAPLGGHSDGIEELSGDVAERLAELEHERWMGQRLASGLRYGSVRTTTEHPDLVPWTDLTESAREKDRVFVRKIPQILRTEGFQLVANPATRPWG